MTTKQTQHTPGPLTVSGDRASGLSLHDAAGRMVADCDIPPSLGDVMPGDVIEYIASQDANARRLAHCWNCHADLLAALEAIVAAPDHPMRKKCKDIARAAIAKARGQ